MSIESMESMIQKFPIAVLDMCDTYNNERHSLCNVTRYIGHIKLDDGRLVEVQITLVADGDEWLDAGLAEEVFG